MPVRIEDSGDEGEVLKTTTEDSDEEIISVKRNRTSRIKSDESDEENDNHSIQPSSYVVSENRENEKSDGISEDNVNSIDRCHNVLISQDREFLSRDESPTLSPLNSSTSGDKRIDFKQIFANKDLYDPEDSDDDTLLNNDTIACPEKPSDHYDAEGSSDEGSRERVVEKKSKLPKARKSSKKTQSKKEVDEIHSETQRLVRHSRVSLPYHKPRQRTLAEFLQRRPSIPAKSLRMSSDELKLLAIQVAKRAKEAEKFYKSSSDEEKSLQPEINQECNSNENSSNAIGVHGSFSKNHETFLKQESPSEYMQSEDTKQSQLALTEEKERDEISFKEDTVISLNNYTEHTEKSSTDPLTKDDHDVSGIDSPDLHLKIKDSEIFDRISKDDKESNILAGNSHLYLIEDTQSAMDSTKVSAIYEKCRSAISNTTIPFCASEIDSQDLCLRIEDTETFDGFNSRRREMQIENVNYSDDVEKIGSSEKGLVVEEKNSSKRFSGNINQEIDSQDLCLRIDDTESHEAVADENTKRKDNTKMSLEITPHILSTQEYEKSTLKNKLVAPESNFTNGEIHSQDICLRIENSESLDAYGSEKIEQSKCVRNVADNISLSRNEMSSVFDDESCSADLHPDILMNVPEDSNSVKSCLRSAQTGRSDFLERSNVNCETGHNNQKSRRNLSEIFSGTETHLKVHSVLARESKDIVIAENADNLKLILEGEETRVAFRQDDSLLLNKKTTHKVDKTEKLTSSEAMVNIESETSANQLTVGKSNENIEHMEKSEDISKEPYELHLYMKDSGSHGKENVIKTIQILRGNDGSDSKNAKLLRTMSLLEDRLQSTRKSLKLQSAVPQLKGSPSKIIDLDNTPSSCEINDLKQRFLRHSFPKTSAPQKSSVEVSVISAEKGSNGELEVKKEIVCVESETENLVGTRAKLRKLKEDLQRQIVKEREEEWNKRQSEMQETNSLHKTDEKSGYGLSDDDEEISDSDDNTKLKHEEEDDEEEEDSDEMDDEEMTEKQKRQQKKRSCAFVDDEAEVSDEDTSAETTDSDDSENGVATSVHADDSESNKASVLDVNEIGTSCTSLKRLKTFDMFESQEISSDVNCSMAVSPASLKNTKNTLRLTRSVSDIEAELDSSLSIPPYQPGGAISQITDVVGEELYLKILPPTMPTPLPKEGSETESVFSQFPQSSASYGLDITNGVDMDEAELLGLCSGKFTSQVPVSQDEISYSNSEIDPVLTPTQMLEEPKTSIETILKSSTFPHVMRNKFSEDSKSEPLCQDEVINQPEKSQSHTIGRKKFVVVSSDEEEEEPDNSISKRSHKLTFSDDEDDDEVKIDSGDECSNDDEPVEVEYDSEENEVAVKAPAAKEFFENEAELSESEWGSADEDEMGLDDFEVEDGDEEKLDHRKVKEQLDKIHMRRVLDEDQEEVRRLQELLLEDGEFHSEGGGRQRQFRWKNLNNTDDLQFSRKSDDEKSGGEDNEEEDESEWRRKRFERESFLQEHKNSLEKEEEFLPEAVKFKFKTPLPTVKKNVQIKRGSFLARSEAALARIAQLTKNAGEVSVLAPTNSRNFVFATLSQDPKESDKGVKRRATKTETPAAKKICVHASLLDQIG